MKTPLNPHEKQQLWRQYQAQKQTRKKLDPHLKRDLKHGWLFPYLTQIENLMWGRWQYWKECQLLPEVAWERWQWENTIALIENRKPEAIPKFVIEHALPDREIPQISWSYNEQAEKMLIDCLDAIPASGGWNSWSSWSYLRYFLHWLLFGLGHPGYKELPEEPQGCEGASMRLYQLFDLSYLLMFPYDYFGRILPQISGKKAQQATGFFPTPMVVSEFINGDLTELRVSDLRFTPDEAAAFLNQVMGLAISAREVSALEQRTEGWIAGLQLAALSLQGRENIPDFVAAFSGDDRYIVDYLLEEVLQRQPDSVRHFLLQTAILDRLSGSLCDAVTDKNDGQEMLETLERGNLFIIPLDNKRQWYRYHHLFADVLQAHALMEWPDRISSLHGRASEWYEQNGLFSDAIRHALAAQDFERAADLIEQVWPTMRKRQQEATVLNWMKGLPDPLIRERPILSITYALVLLNAGQLEAVEARLQDAERRLAQLEQTVLGQTVSGSPAAQAAQQYRSLPASIANARAYRAQALGDFASTITYAQQALALLSTDDEYERGTTAAFLGLAYWASGNVEAARRSFAEGLMVFEKLGGIQIAVAATFILANMGMAQGRLQATVETCEQALQLAAQQRGPMLQGTAELHLALSEIRYEQGDLPTAKQLLLEGESLCEQVSISGANYLWWLVFGVTAI